MLLAPGYTRFHEVILDGLTAKEFRNMEKRLRKRIDCGHYTIAQRILSEIKQFAGDNEVNREVFEAIRKDASDRWQRTWGQFPDN
jgi:hypothetical protein